ncbi:hypothetical protein ACOMHN_059298 [Nucella lapillus]
MKEDFEDWMVSFVKTKFASSASKEPQDSKIPTLATVTDHDGQQTLRSWPHLPRLSIFSGTSTKEGEATFDLWHYEVKCLERSQYTEATILEAVRRSLRGEAARVAMRLGPSTTLNQLVAKFSSIFRSVLDDEDVLVAFYSAQQGEVKKVDTRVCLASGEALNTKPHQPGPVRTDPHHRNYIQETHHSSTTHPPLITKQHNLNNSPGD